MPKEDQHEYDAVLLGFPHDAAEDALVRRLTHAHWRSLRSRRVETEMLNITAATERALPRKIVQDCSEDLNPHDAITVGFMKIPQMYLRCDALSTKFAT